MSWAIKRWKLLLKLRDDLIVFHTFLLPGTVLQRLFTWEHEKAGVAFVCRIQDTSIFWRDHSIISKDVFIFQIIQGCSTYDTVPRYSSFECRSCPPFPLHDGILGLLIVLDFLREGCILGFTSPLTSLHSSEDGAPYEQTNTHAFISWNELCAERHT